MTQPLLSINHIHKRFHKINTLTDSEREDIFFCNRHTLRTVMNVTYSNESIQMDKKELTSFFSLQYLSYFFEMQTQRNTVYIVGENHEEPKGIT